MSQKYIVSSHLRPAMRVELTKVEFDELKHAVLGLLHRTDVEENYDCVIENYLELEEYILSEALRSVVARPRSDNISWQEPRHNTARKLSNFLSSARLDWFRIVLRYGDVGGEEASLDPDPTDSVIEAPIKPTREGELFIFVNDAVLGIPGLYDLFYRNNKGAAKLTVKRR
jgi:hypothetical protein